MRRLFFICCCCLAVGASAQERMVLPAGIPDSASLTAYIQTTDRLVSRDPDSAARRYLLAANMAKIAGYNEAVVHCLLAAGDYYFNRKKNYRLILALLPDAVPYSRNMTDPAKFILIPRLYNLLAGAYFYTGNHDSATHYYLSALRAIDSLQLGRDQLYITISGNLGSVLAASRQFRQGAMYMLKVLELLQQKAETKKLTANDSIALALAYGNLGSLYANYLNKPDSAQYWWKHAAFLHRLLGNTIQLQGTYANMAGCWLVDNQLDIRKAKPYLDSAILIDPLNAETDVQIQISLGRLYYHLGQYDTAIKLSLHAIALCEDAGLRERKMVPYETLFYCYASLGNYKESRRYQRLNKLISDSLFNEETNYAISKAETLYRVAEKDKALAEQKAKLYQQRYWLAGSAGGGAILLLTLVGFVRNSRQKRRLERERIQNLERQQKIDQLQVERETEERERKRIAQELHDGLGVLLSAAKINQTLLARIVPDAEGTKPFHESKLILSQMQQEVEWITNNLVPDYITENGFESALHTLAAKFNRPGVFDIHLESYGAVRELHPDRAFSLYRALEEMLHNAVKHSGGRRLDIQLMYHPDQLHISLEDNGKGFDTKVTYAGMGMQNIRNRIMGLRGAFELASVPGTGTSYILQIPY